MTPQSAFKEIFIPVIHYAHLLEGKAALILGKKRKKKQQQNGNETTTQNQHTNIYNQANSPRSGNAPVLLLREE